MRAKDLIEERKAIKRGTARTTQISNVYLEFLIQMAERGMHTHTENMEERRVIVSMINIVNRGFFDDR